MLYIRKNHSNFFSSIFPGKRARQTEGEWSPVWGPKPKRIQVLTSKFQQKRSRQTEGQWSPVWGPKPKKFHVQSPKFQNPFRIIFRHLFSKRGSQDVKRSPLIRVWLPKGGNLQDEVGKRMSWQHMSRIKLGAWSRVSK